MKHKTCLMRSRLYLHLTLRFWLAALCCASIASTLHAQTTTVFTTGITIASGDVTYEGQNIVINGCTVTVNGSHQFNSVTISNGAVLTHQPATAAQEYSMALTLTGRLLVDATSSLNVTGCGYLPGYTLGNTTTNAAAFTAGGSYGGLGGLCCNSTDNPVYGDYHNPNELGSGSGTYSTGASGGGLVRITAAAAHVDGSILANGGNSYDGGSGGGLFLNVVTLSGAGQISANGGNSLGGNDGGGGGRVAIYYGTSTFNLSSNVTANGGSGPSMAGS